MKIKWPQRNQEISEDRYVWHVRVPEDKHLDLTFDTRAAARRYKKILAESQRQLQPVIVQHKFEDGYMTDKVAS